jgi:hypothetical protein
MPNENLNKYVAALTEKDNSSSSKDEAFTIYLSDSSRKIFKEIKKRMEWNNNIVLNSALTLFFKDGLNDEKKLEFIATIKKEQQLKKLPNKLNDKTKLEFYPTIKNESRIKEFADEYNADDLFSYIAKSGIEILYKRLIRSDKDE